MGRLVYNAITSLDGYTVDREGSFSWAQPDEEVHAFVNDLVRPVGTHLYGRRMYDVMAVWEDLDAEGSAAVEDFGEVWRASDKVVFSRTLDEVRTARTRLEHEFDPEAVQRLVRESEQDVAVSGAHLAAEALRAGLVDELQQVVTPVVVGGGTSWLPDDVRFDLELTETRRFGSGAVFLRYTVRR